MVGEVEGARGGDRDDHCCQYSRHARKPSTERQDQRQAEEPDGGGGPHRFP